MEEKTLAKTNTFEKVSYFLKNSSVHAISQVGHSNSKFRKIFWLSLLVLCISGCTYEMSRWLNIYFQYPVLINMDIQNPLKAEFPAVTVCNLNRVKSEHAACVKQGRRWQECPTIEVINLRTLIFSERKKIPPILDPESKSERKLQEELTLFLERYSDLDKQSREEYGYRYHNLIQRCFFDSATCGFSNFTLFHDLQFGNCYTFNNEKDSGKLFSYRAGPHNGLELELDPAEESTYMDITPRVGFLVVIHNPDEAPNPAENGINISPGFETHLSFTKTAIKRLPSPYRDKCFNYNSSATDATIRSEFDCVRVCIQEVSMSSCSCIDPLLPTLERMEKCDLKNTSAMSCLNDVLDKMSEHGLPCNCPLPCSTTSYIVEASSSPWSSAKMPRFKNKANSAESDSDSAYDDPVYVSYYDPLNDTVYDEPDYDTVNDQPGEWMDELVQKETGDKNLIFKSKFMY